MSNVETTATRRNRKAAEDAGRNAARETIMDLQFGDDTDSEEAQRVEGNTAAVAEKRDVGFDIFENVGHELSQKGVKLTYTIKKNNELAGVKKHPYNWIQLAKDFGFGDYQVIAKDPNKKYVSSQNQTISEDAEVFNHLIDEDEKLSTQNNSTSQIGWQQPQMSFLEIFNLMQTQSDRARSESMQQATVQSQNSMGMITAMTEMMKNQQLQGQQIFIEMTKMTSQVAEKMAQSQERLMEKLNARMDKLTDLSTKKPEGPGWLEMIKMQSDSQNKGFELFEKITRLSDLKAAEKVELIEDSRSNAPGTKSKSMTDSLIESLLPVITASMLKVNQPEQQAPQLANPQPRRLVQRSEQVFQGTRPDRPIQSRPGTTTQRTQTPIKKEATKPRSSNSPIIQNSGTLARDLLVIPAVREKAHEKSPVIEKEAVIKHSRPQVEPSIADKVQVIDSALDNTIREKCNDVLPLFLGNLMLESTPSNVAANRVIEFLNEHDISRELFLKHIDLDAFLAVAKQYDLPQQAFEWLNELYAHIQGQPRNDVRRESRASGQNNASTRG